MKQGFIILAVMIIILFGVMYIESHYTKEAIVTNIEQDTVTVQDTEGNEWQFIASEYELGQNLTLVMFTNNTDSRADDIIQKVK